MNECQICGLMQEGELTAMFSRSGDEVMACDKCVGEYEVYADMEYERQREEGIELDGQRIQCYLVSNYK